MMSDEASNDISVDLVTMTTIVLSLQRVVADFFGPQCMQTLLTSQTGKAVVTSDGFSVIEALQPAHPITQVVFKAMKSCHSVTLDGSKTFLIYFANFLVHLQEEISLGKFCHSGTNITSNKHSFEKRGTVCARKYIRHMKQNVLPKVCDILTAHSDKLASKMLQKMDKNNVMKCVIQTCLMPHYNPKLCNHFTDLLFSSLPNECLGKSCSHTMQFLVDNFFDISIKVSDKSYGESTHVDPFLINRDFTLKCDNLLKLSQLSVLILKGKVDGTNTDEENEETFLVTQAGQVVNLISHRRKVVENFANSCTVNHIDLVVCSQGVPGYALDFFRDRNISVIANVAEKDVNLLETLSGKLSLNGVSDSIEERNILTLNGVCELIVGGKKYVQLKVNDMRCPFKHLIVCAPTIGLCDQLAVTLQKALNAVNMCLTPGITQDMTTHGSDMRNIENIEELGSLSESSTQENLRPGVKADKYSAADLHEMFANLGMKEIQYYGPPRIVENHKLSIIEGGGSFEILATKCLRDFSDNCTDSSLSLMCRILERTMISLVKKLYENTSIQSQSARGFLEVKTVLEEKVSCGQLMGLDRRGLPCDMSEKGVIEPLMSKIHILHCVLNLAEQFLGIDSIVSVRKLESS